MCLFLIVIGTPEQQQQAARGSIGHFSGPVQGCFKILFAMDYNSLIDFCMRSSPRNRAMSVSVRPPRSGAAWPPVLPEGATVVRPGREPRRGRRAASVRQQKAVPQWLSLDERARPELPATAGGERGHSPLDRETTIAWKNDMTLQKVFFLFQPWTGVSFFWL